MILLITIMTLELLVLKVNMYVQRLRGVKLIVTGFTLDQLLATAPAPVSAPVPVPVLLLLQ